jgi:hypothetical protein
MASVTAPCFFLPAAGHSTGFHTCAGHLAGFHTCAGHLTGFHTCGFGRECAFPRSLDTNVGARNVERVPPVIAACVGARQIHYCRSGGSAPDTSGRARAGERVPPVNVTCVGARQVSYYR